MQRETSDSRSSTEEELRSLRYQENALTSDIVHISEGPGTLKDKIIALAKIMEERINRADPLSNFGVDQISTQIARQLRSLNCPIARVVREYLPDKYKNANMVREVKIIEQLNNIIEDCAVEPRSATNAELENSLEFIIKSEHLKDDLGTLLTNKKWDVRSEAQQRGISLLDETYRDQISARDYRFEIPDDATLEQLNLEVQYQGQRYEQEIHTFYQVKYPEYPATTREEARKYGNSTRVLANMWAIVNEEKWSGEIDHWLDRNYWKKAQSSHKSGNSTMFPTTLCARCSANIEEDPKDFHVSKYDTTSPTGYRCDNCGCTKIRLRENTREQVGDKSPEIDRFASEIINHLGDYVDIVKDWRKRYLNPAIYARKIAISPEFERASFGKEKIVIPRRTSTNSKSEVSTSNSS